ncbi:MAG: aldehyde dehydrogenase family protein [Rhodobacteraceae bacterium]|nr:aldehyde dehydrogenase family protein [Paracoccaceae bacterium]
MLDQNAIDALRGTPVATGRLWISGRWEDGAGDPIPVVSPIDGQPLTTLAHALAGDVDRACAAARAAFEDGRWSRLPPARRGQVLLRLAELIERDALELAVLGVRDNGTEIAMAMAGEPGSAAGTFRYYAGAVDKIMGEVAPSPDAFLGMVLKEPVGVVGAIVPWNFPLMIAAWKLAPALAAGNSVVLKPAESASLTLLRLAELAAEAGLPDGVLNVVTGPGTTTGEALALSHEVDVLTFTGSGGVGRRLLEYSARSNLKRVYLELGGKSANIVFADAPDLDAAAKVSAMAIFRNSGQVCVAASRLLVEASVHDAFVEKVAEHARALKVGDPLHLGHDIGAVHSDRQLAGNLAHLEQALAEGAHCVTGGGRILSETGGYYMAPTVLTGVRPDHAIARQEVFGPVVAALSFETEEEAVAIANATDYGLAGGVWTSNLGRAHRMIRRVKTGVMHVNCYGGADVTVPLGGVKQSGNGHDKSLHALDKYLDLKTAWIAL